MLRTGSATLACRASRRSNDAERPAILLAVQAAQHLLLGGTQPLARIGQGVAAARGGQDAAGPAVGRVGASLDEPGRLEVVEQVGHDRAVHPQAVGQGQLAAVLVPGGRGEHLEAARAAGQVGQGVLGGLEVAAEDHARAPSPGRC